MIHVQDLKKFYNHYCVLNISELTIEKGTCVGLVGNNGAGKTTFFSLLLDLIHPSQGSITSKGIPVNQSENWKQYTSAFIDESFLIGYLTPEEYFYFVGSLRGWQKQQVDHFIAQYEEFFNGEILERKKYIRDLSKGNSKKVGIIAALIGDPEIIILDEPFANLDPSTQIRLKRIIKDLAAMKDKIILVSSHDLQHTVEVSDRIIALEKGEIKLDIVPTSETLIELENFFSV